LHRLHSLETYNASIVRDS